MHSGHSSAETNDHSKRFLKAVYIVKKRPRLSEISKGELLHGPGTANFDSAFPFKYVCKSRRKHSIISRKRFWVSILGMLQALKKKKALNNYDKKCMTYTNKWHLYNYKYV